MLQLTTTIFDENEAVTFNEELLKQYHPNYLKEKYATIKAFVEFLQNNYYDLSFSEYELKGLMKEFRETICMGNDMVNYYTILPKTYDYRKWGIGHRYKNILGCKKFAPYSKAYVHNDTKKMKEHISNCIYYEAEKGKTSNLSCNYNDYYIQMPLFYAVDRKHQKYTNPVTGEEQCIGYDVLKLNPDIINNIDAIYEYINKMVDNYSEYVKEERKKSTARSAIRSAKQERVDATKEELLKLIEELWDTTEPKKKSK